MPSNGSETMRAHLIGTCAAAMLLLLTGCGATETGTGAAEPGEGSHTMSDGTVMEGETHIHDDSHDHESEDSSAGGPSPAAEMVCTGQVVDDVTRIMGLDAAVEPASSWEDPMYTCTFDLDQGPLVLRVHDATDRASGMAHFQTLRTGQDDAVPLRGVYSLGLPAYETRSGTVAFVKDGKTLEVDASRLTGRLGSEGEKDRTELAYAVATSVLACWTEHA
jgi:hypothetical protein